MCTLSFVASKDENQCCDWQYEDNEPLGDLLHHYSLIICQINLMRVIKTTILGIIYCKSEVFKRNLISAIDLFSVHHFNLIRIY